jgi:glycosyltransferase involved in cell wall biosynthesis
MPVYNGEKYLRSAIESILSQTYRDFVLLIIDDGSTDSSLQISRSFDDPRIVIERNGRNLGLIRTLNKGLDLTRTEFVARMDCDDWAFPRRLERQVTFLDRNPDVGLCGSHYEIFAGERREVIKAPETHDEIFYGMLFDNMLLHSSVLARTEFLNRYRLRYDEGYQHLEDYELWVRAIRLTRLANVPEVLLQYRSHPENVSHRHRSTQFSHRDRIRLVHLEALGLAPSEEEKTIHLDLISLSFSGDGDRLEKARQWIDRLDDAIGRKCSQGRSIIRADLSRVWYAACGRNAQKGFAIFSHYLKSPLGRWGPKKLLAKLFIRCLLRLPIAGLAAAPAGHPS